MAVLFGTLLKIVENFELKIINFSRSFFELPLQDGVQANLFVELFLVQGLDHMVAELQKHRAELVKDRVVAACLHHVEFIEGQLVRYLV